MESLSSFQVLVAPPLFRSRPSWYQTHLSQIATRFSATLSANRRENLHLLPSFASQDLFPDGVFLTPVAGLHYVIHLFDQSITTLALASDHADSKLVKVQESVRLHDDRLAYLEKRHDHLAIECDTRIASNAEARDWLINRSEEDWVTIIGLPRLAVDGHREWQVAVRRQVIDFIKLVLKTNRTNLEYSVLSVADPMRFRSAGLNVLNVKLDSVESSKRIRELYSGFFRRNRPVQLPSSLRGVSLRNKVTLDTRIRIEIMKQLANNYKDKNPGSTVDVRGYGSRPLLMTTAPSGSSGASATRSTTFTFIDAVTKLPATFSDEALGRIFGVVREHHPGELRKLFVVLSDDDRDRCQGIAKAQPRGQRGPRSGHSVSFASAAVTASGSTSGPGDGMELEAGFLASLRAPPPPPQPASEEDDRRHHKKSRSRSRSKSRSRSRSKSRSRSRSKSRSRSRSRSPSRSKHGSKRGRKSNKSKKRQRSPSSSSSGSCSGSESGSDSDSSRTSKVSRTSKSSKTSKTSKSGKTAPKSKKR